jgi:hypothetical protein
MTVTLKQIKEGITAAGKAFADATKPKIVTEDVPLGKDGKNGVWLRPAIKLNQ